MTRDEFESILEEAFIEGYNSALEDIQEDILDEEAFDLEGEYDYYTESKNVRKQMDELATHKGDFMRVYGKGNEEWIKKTRKPPKNQQLLGGGRRNWNVATEKPGYIVRGYNSMETRDDGKTYINPSSPPRGRIKVKDDNNFERDNKKRRELIKAKINKLK